MTATTPRTSATEVMHARNNQMRRHQMEAALTTEEQSTADFVRNLVGAAYVTAEMVRPGRNRDQVEPTRTELDTLAVALGTYARLISEEEARHARAVLAIEKRIEGLPTGAVGGAA